MVGVSAAILRGAQRRLRRADFAPRMVGVSAARLRGARSQLRSEDFARRTVGVSAARLAAVFNILPVRLFSPVQGHFASLMLYSSLKSV